MLSFLERWAVDGRFVLGVLVLSLFGIAMVYSAGEVNVPTPDVEGAWQRQLVWFTLAIVAFTLVARIPLRWWEWGAIPAYVVMLVLLAATLLVPILLNLLLLLDLGLTLSLLPLADLFLL